MKIKAIMLCWSHNVQQHPPRALIWVCRGEWKQKPPEGGGRMLSLCTELCSRSLNWVLLCSQLCLAFLPHTLGKPGTQRSNAAGLSREVRTVIPLKPSPLESSDTVRSGCGGVPALCNDKPVTGQVLQGQWALIQGSRWASVGFLFQLKSELFAGLLSQKW